ncbi:MAG: urease accessory protein UreD [Acidobacteriota bacterium]|nr:urease accessory protein UreD [Acidobacteriota bacterium]
MSPAASAPHASISFRAGIGGEPIVTDVQPSAAHTFAPDRWGVTVVGSAAHPEGGDHLRLSVEVGVGCAAEVRSAAATLARVGSRRPHWAGPAGSSMDVTATVASDALLTWRPEPGVATEGCSHQQNATIEMAGSARLVWRDEFLIDQRGVPRPGTWASRIRIDRGGWPTFCSELAVGPGSLLWESPAVLEGARVVSQIVIVDPHHERGWKAARATEGSASGAALPLAGPGVHLLAWGDDLLECRATLRHLVNAGGVPSWAAERWHSSPVVRPPG